MHLNTIIEKHSILDKTNFHATTSLKFKEDIFNFFSSIDSKKLICTEFGTSRGFSTVILSYLFKEIYTINLKHDILSKELLSDLDNVTLFQMDLYGNNNFLEITTLPKADVYFIDAGHSYTEVVSDTSLALKHCNKGAYFIFDDFGAYDSVHQAINFFLDNSVLKVVKFVGMDAGWRYGEDTLTMERVLQRNEGIICQVV